MADTEESAPPRLPAGLQYEEVQSRSGLARIGPAAVNTELEDKAQQAGIILSGSLIAVPAHQRQSLADRLLGAGHWVHADMIAGRYLGQEGVQAEEIDRLATQAGLRLDVHLMVDDLAEAINGIPHGIGRITIQYPAAGGLEAAEEQARAKAQSVWIALDNPSPASLQQALDNRPDGLLAMLTPPGMPGHSADVRRLDALLESPRGLPPLGVDGGVNAKNFELLRDAGIVYAVAGRALVSGGCAAAPAGHLEQKKVTP
ncbi:hypothetical protein [Arthrobacter sp. 24S4-2]|uniref:hypothetical protein n=1 Tax=Arthrobacter sp. 24S4-2 TaxID=2575374 RepID=UPI0015865229|nr:hypothetical protein [Arthrobacter sp. 24S4-2]